jgi:hypothetical protein
MRKRNFISGIVLLVLAGAIMMEASKLSFGSLREPEAGFLPFILSILLAVFSLILLGQSLLPLHLMPLKRSCLATLRNSGLGQSKG